MLLLANSAQRGFHTITSSYFLSLTDPSLTAMFFLLIIACWLFHVYGKPTLANRLYTKQLEWTDLNYNH